MTNLCTLTINDTALANCSDGEMVADLQTCVLKRSNACTAVAWRAMQCNAMTHDSKQRDVL